MFKYFLAFVCFLAVSDSLIAETNQKTQEFDVEKLIKEKFADEDPCVGLLGDTARIKFSGQQQLTPDMFRKALAFDLEYQTAARPSASLATFLETLESRLQEGLLHSGFLHGTAKVNFEANAIHVHIKEGSKFKNAGLRITGTKNIDAELLERTLLDPANTSLWIYRFDEIALDLPRGFDSSSTDWEVSETISADSKTLVKLRQRVFKALLNQGYPHAKFNIDVVPKDNDTAQYFVAIDDEGPQGTIEEITVKGLERHSEDQILKYLNLSPGMLVDAQLLDSIHEKLRDSCRFWKYQVAVRVFDPKQYRYATSPRGVLLLIRLIEYPSVPPLGEPLSEAEQVMKRCANWLESYTQQESSEIGDLVIEKRQTQITNDWMDFGFRLVISPNQGTLFHTTLLAPWNFDHSLLSLPGELRLFSHDKSEKWSHVSRTFMPTVSLQCRSGGMDHEEYRNSFKLGYGMKGARSKSQPTLKWEIECEPVVMVNLLYQHDPQYEFQEDELCITTTHMKLQIDRNTGELRHVSLTSPDISPQEWGSITFRKDAFTNEIKELQTKTSTFDERCDPELPLTSFSQFALDQLLAQPFVKEIDIWRIPLKALRNETKSGCLDEMLADYHTLSPFSASRDDRFELPQTDSADDDDDYSQVMVRLTPFLADSLFPHGSWPWTLTREIGFGYRSGLEEDATEKRAREIHRITRDEKTGVLGNLSAVRFAKYFLPKIPAEQIMTKADINEARFLQDVRLLVKGDTGSALMAHKLADLLATFPESELTALKDDLPARWYAALTKLKHRRETHPSETPAESIEAVAATFWNSGLGEHVTSPYKNTATDFSETAEANQSSRR